MDAKHTCSLCLLTRCTQHHLVTVDEGESYQCSVCRPQVFGMCGPTHLRVPGTMVAGTLSDELDKVWFILSSQILIINLVLIHRLLMRMLRSPLKRILTSLTTSLPTRRAFSC